MEPESLPSLYVPALILCLIVADDALIQPAVTMMLSMLETVNSFSLSCILTWYPVF